jgi:hypothetical protein
MRSARCRTWKFANRSPFRESIPALDGAALSAVRDWLFEPATRDGKPVACVVRAPVTLQLQP